ncbi:MULTISPECIES: DNA-directed RNA polymerase subunit beta [Salinicoccus]|uniref:DNA-directed RNA polymerase subunit beta n=2 Tax=Salinicoccus TaxID=45669 RepID=A0ABV5Z481_9STAP
MAEESRKLVHRRFPLIVRILLYVYVAIIVFFVGLMIGYGILNNPMEVFRLETWEHIINMTKE